jgi:tetratricopeptide (TPR) repeat protein
MEARRHMLEGIFRLNSGDFKTALHHFEQAVDIRTSLPWRQQPESAWLLAAAWINRSDVLRILGQTQEAIDSLDLAIDAMSHVPVGQHPAYLDRLILAWINRGTACGEASRLSEAFDGFTKAEALLGSTSGGNLLASMLHGNRAKLLLDTGYAFEGWKDAEMSVERLRHLITTEDIAEVSIKARGILCRALAMVLDDPEAMKQAGDWIAKATDAVEEALALVRSFDYRGTWTDDLVRYGAKIYRICQPQFLSEFLCEWLVGEGPLATNTALKKDMDQELVLAMAELHRRVVSQSHDTEFVHRSMEILGSMQYGQMKIATASL